VLAFGQCALARVSYLVSTRAKARLKPKTGQYLSGALSHFAPGLTYLPDHGAQCFRATGTIIARDVKKLFENKEHSLQSNPRAIIFVDPDFDGYLAELAKGLKKAIKKRVGERPKIAIVLTEGVLAEAATAGLTEDGDPVRAFAASQRDVALNWLAL
jgi:hypothetical protein